MIDTKTNKIKKISSNMKYKKDENTIWDKVLFVGIDYKNPKGGIAIVEYEYNKIISPCNFVRTTVTGNKIFKIVVFIESILRFVFYLIFKRQIEIVHIHGASYVSFWRKSIFILIAKLFRKKVVYHMHGGGFKEFRDKHQKIVDFIVSKVDVVIALSETWMNFFKNEMKCDNVCIIHNIIEKPVYNKSARKNKINCDFLFLGLICKNKGIYDLLNIIQKNQILFRSKNIRFILGGNGETETLQNYIQLHNLKDLVIFKGWVSGNKKIELLNYADIYILPSYYEGVPISILEAMSYRMPIISTNIGGIPEIVQYGVNGYLTNPGNLKDITKFIIDLADSMDLRKKMGEESYGKCQQYLPENVKNELMTLYTSLLN